MIVLKNIKDKISIGEFGTWDSDLITYDTTLTDYLRIYYNGFKILSRLYSEFTNEDETFTPVDSSEVAQLIDDVLKQANNNNFKSSWEYLVTKYSSLPVLQSSITGGDVWLYTLKGVDRYRFVPSPYDSTQDSFYGSFDGTNLTDLIKTRG